MTLILTRISFKNMGAQVLAANIALHKCIIENEEDDEVGDGG